jgi:hypothetical protein
VTQVPAQDLPENQDETVNYTVDQYGRRLDSDGNPVEAAPVGYGSGATADLTRPPEPTEEAKPKTGVKERETKQTETKQTETKLGDQGGEFGRRSRKSE